MDDTMNPTTRKELDCALTLRESSPGLTQEKVVSIVSAYAHDDEDYINPNSVGGLVIYQAYLGGIEAAGQFSRIAFAGIDLTEGY